MKREKSAAVTGAETVSAEQSAAERINERVKQKFKRALPKSGRLPSKTAYGFFMGTLGPYFKSKCNVQLCGELPQITTPCVIVSNHPSFFDWVYGPLVLRSRVRPNVVVNRYYYYNKALAPLLNSVAAIPKTLFSPDIDTIKRIKAAIAAGGCVYIFPEGRLSPHGAMESAMASTCKLLKNLGVPVYNVHLEGSYLTKPKWASGIRKGRVDVTVTELFTAEQLAAEADGVLEQRLCEALDYDDFRWQERNRVAYKKIRGFAEGLHNILYMCPKCGEELTMRTKGDRIYCEHCGNGAVLNEYYDFVPFDGECVVPKNMRDWFEWQKSTERQRIEKNGGCELQCAATLKRPLRGGDWFGESGKGTARLSMDGLHYEGTSDGASYTIDIPIHMIPAMPYVAGSNFEFFSHGEFYGIIPENPMESTKWAVVAEQLHQYALKAQGEGTRRAVRTMSK